MRHHGRHQIRIGRYMRQTVWITVITATTFGVTDITLTSLLRTRGFSQFFESSKEAGFINKRNFSGVFGGPLDDFSAKVDIDEFGTRRVSANNCNSETSQSRLLIFAGDSMTAGFEVENNQTYSSRFSQLNCSIQVVNGGVRAHDTHMAIANAFRISKEMRPKKNNPGTTIVYMATENDFTENDNKDAYRSMKSKFGSIYDGIHHAPARSQWLNTIRMFTGDKMYFTTKALSQFQAMKAIRQDSIKQSDDLEKDDCLRKSARALDIYQSSISQAGDRQNHIYFMGVHPLTTDFNRSEKIENCLQETIEIKRLGRRIKLVRLHKIIRSLNPEFIDSPANRFRRDGHYSATGHKQIADALNLLPELTFSRRQQIYLNQDSFLDNF